MRKKITIAVLIFLGAYIAWRVYLHNQAKALLPSRKSLIEARLEEMLETYAVPIRKRCQETMLEEAREMADSIVFIRANELMLFDSTSRPPKPTKPLMPLKKELKDSLEVAPILSDDVPPDSIPEQ